MADGYFDSDQEYAKLVSLRRQRAQKQRGEVKRTAFLHEIEKGLTINKACEAVGWQPPTYRKHRTRYPEWAARVDVIRNKRAGDPAVVMDWTEGFAEFRMVYFGMESPWHHLVAINAYETTKLGNITLILWPPEHGKTTLFEDYASYMLAIDPEQRFTVGSETQTMSRKILRRVRGRMSEGSGFPEFLGRWGPFEPQGKNSTGSASQQPWGVDQFDVFKKRTSDERDYSMQALGMNSQITGTRCTYLHADDVQSVKTANQTQKMLELFRQDWLSRPGEWGRTGLAGTRVRDDDFYEALIREFDDDILRVIKFPAIIKDNDTGEEKPLWPERYDLVQLERMRRKVGEDAWFRNYMQEPRAIGNPNFTEESVARCFNPLRRAGDAVSEYPSIILTVDPGLQPGVNAIMALELTGETIYVLDYVEDPYFNNWEQMFTRLETMIGDYPPGSVTDVVIEANAYQKGLIHDQRVEDLRDRYGFNIRPHVTHLNKYEEDIGIPSMATSMARTEIDIPNTTDDRTRWIAEEAKRQLVNWRPGRKGTELKQEFVVTLWFGWKVWRERRRGDLENRGHTGPVRKGLPWKPTRGGLLIPKHLKVS